MDSASRLRHDEAGPGVGRLFSRHLGAEAWCDMVFTDQTTYGEFVASLPRPSCSCSFSVAAMSRRAALDIAAPLANAILHRSGADAQPLNAQERQAMEPVFAGILAEIQKAWGSRLDTVFGDTCVETEPERLQVTARESLVVLLGLEVCTPHMAGRVPVAYPVDGGLFELRQHFARR